MQEEYQILEKVEIIIAFERDISDTFSLWGKIKARSVQLMTRSVYFHTEIAIDDVWYSFGQEGLVELKLRPLKDNYDYVTITKTVSQEQKAILNEFLKMSTNYDYDWWAIFFTFTIPLGVDAAQEYTCAEFVVKVLQILSVRDASYVQAHKTAPDELYEMLS